MKKWNIFCLPLCISILFCSCGNNDDFSVEKSIYVSNGIFMENSYVYSMDQATTEYLDFATMQVKPYCSKANCTHKDGACMSRWFSGMQYGPIPHGNQIYYFAPATITWTDVDGDGREETQKIEDSLLCYNFETDATEKVASWEGSEGDCYSGACIVDDKLYFVATRGYTEFAELPGLETPETIPMESDLYCFDLNSRKLTAYGSLTDDDLQYSGAASTRNCILRGISDGKLYFSYSYLEDASQEDTIENETHLCFTMDLESGEILQSEEAPPELVKEEYRCHTEGDTAVVYHGEQEWRFPAVEYGFYSGELTLCDDKVWHLGNGDSWYYDLKANEKVSCSAYQQEIEPVSVIDMYQNQYIVRIVQDDIVTFETFSLEE